MNDKSKCAAGAEVHDDPGPYEKRRCAKCGGPIERVSVSKRNEPVYCIRYCYDHAVAGLPPIPPVSDAEAEVDRLLGELDGLAHRMGEDILHPEILDGTVSLVNRYISYIETMAASWRREQGRVQHEQDRKAMKGRKA